MMLQLAMVIDTRLKTIVLMGARKMSILRCKVACTCMHLVDLIGQPKENFDGNAKITQESKKK